MGIINAKQTILWIMAICLPLTSGCLAALHSYQVDSTEYNKKLTLGTVQREIKEGMSSAEVAEILGAPNIVSTDSQELEVWIYDRISTSTVYSKSGVGLMGGIFPESDDVSVFAGRGGLMTGAESTNQKVLTVIVKFDAQNKVRGIAYHASSF